MVKGQTLKRTNGYYFVPIQDDDKDLVLGSKKLSAIKVYLWQLYVMISSLLLANLTCHLLTDILKYRVGRLRPHFIDLCQPKLSNGTVLSRTSVCTNPNEYIVDFTCTNSDASDYNLKNVGLSFVSGHTSFISCSFFFIIFYLHHRYHFKQFTFFKALVQAILFYCIVFVGTSRISDNKHHWQDVIVGIIQGALIAGCTLISTFKTSQCVYLSQKINTLI